MSNVSRSFRLKFFFEDLGVYLAAQILSAPVSDTIIGGFGLLDESSVQKHGQSFRNPVPGIVEVHGDHCWWELKIRLVE
jgi:hypothetical protein